MIMMNLTTTTTTTAANNSNFIQSTIDPYAIVGVSEYSKVVESTFLILVITVAFTANTSLWLVVLTTRDLRTESNVLILCLSLADLLVSVLGAPITVSSIIKSRWLFSRDVCTFVGYMNMLTFVASVQSLGVISINRYFKICRPGKYLDIFTFRNVGFMFLGVWLYSGLLSTPPLIGWASYDFLPLASICFCDWAKSPTYAIFMILMCFCVPCFVMILCYVAIIKAFLRSRRAVMAFATSVKSSPTHRESSRGRPNHVTDDAGIKSQPTANGKPHGATRDHRVGSTDVRASGSNLVQIAETSVEPEGHDTPPRITWGMFKESTEEINVTDQRDHPLGSQFTYSTSNNAVKEDDFSRRESRPISEGFTFPSSGNSEEENLKENPEHLSQIVPNSPLLPQQRFFPDRGMDYDIPDNASKHDDNTEKTNHDNNTYDDRSALSEKNATVTMVITAPAESDYNTSFRNKGNPSELDCVTEHCSPEHSNLLENKLETRSPLSRSHSYTDSKDRFSTEYGTIDAAAFQYNRSFSEVPRSSQSPNGAALQTVRSPNSLHFTIGQRNGFEQAVDRRLLKGGYSSDSEPLRAGKTWQRPLLPKHTLLPSLDSLNPFHSHTPSSASTSLASSDFSSSSNQHIPLNVYQNSSQHSPRFHDTPSSPKATSLRLSRSEEAISKLSTAAASDINSSLNNTQSTVQSYSLGKGSKALSVSSPTLLTTTGNRTAHKSHRVIHAQKRAREEYQLAGSLLIVILIFIICWFPYCISMFVSITSTSTHALDITSLLLGYMNSCVNPIVYGVMNRRFKMGYRKMYVKLLQRLPCSRKSKIAPASHISKSSSSIT